MEFRICSLLSTYTLLLTVQSSLTAELKGEFSDDYCPMETFQPRCLKNEVILMKSAIYGRMRIGRCITAEEVDTFGARYVGCSADVLVLLDRKCSGKIECTVRIIEISAENVKPCAAGLSVYLEATYECISIADEKRSCAVDVSTTPIHLIGSRTCGIKSQPWIVEAPVGQKISISLIVFPASNYSTKSQGNIQQPCHNFGVIVDKAGKRNVTICAAGNQRQKKLYLSAGNIVDIFLNSPDEGSSGDDRHVIIRLQAVGCSDIVPPEDAYLKRNGDAVAVGCYTSRKSWHLICEEGKWIGVIGNCSQGMSVTESEQETEPRTARLNNEQVLVILALGGFTLAICLAVICFGAVCLRRSYSQKKMKQEYKTLNYQVNSAGAQQFERAIHPNMHPNIVSDFPGNDVRGMSSERIPTYSVFVGDDGELFNDTNDSVTVNNAMKM